MSHTGRAVEFERYGDVDELHFVTQELPVPADEATASETDVDGVPATLLRSRDGAFTAVVWVDEGVVTAVAGSLSDDEVLSVARGLR